MKKLWNTPIVLNLDVVCTKGGRDSSYKEYVPKTLDPDYGNNFHNHLVGEACQFGNSNNGVVNS